MDETEFVPVLKEGLNFFEAEEGGCFSYCSCSSAGAEEIREAAEDLPEVAQKRLKRV